MTSRRHDVTPEVVSVIKVFRGKYTDQEGTALEVRQRSGVFILSVVHVIYAHLHVQ